MPSIGSTTQVTPLRALAVGALLAEEAVVGAGRRKPVDDQPLGPAVHLGDDVGGAALGRGHLEVPARSLLDDQPARLPGRRRRRGRAARRRAVPVMPAHAAQGGPLRVAQVGAAARRAEVVARPERAQRRAYRLLAAHDGGPLQHQLAHRGDERGSVPDRRRPGDTAGRAGRAVASASVSRSYTTSMWSETKPIGTSTAAGTPSAASASRWSLTSGSSHGWLGGPLRLQ